MSDKTSVFDQTKKLFVQSTTVKDTRFGTLSRVRVSLILDFRIVTECPGKVQEIGLTIDRLKERIMRGTIETRLM